MRIFFPFLKSLIKFSVGYSHFFFISLSEKEFGCWRFGVNIFREIEMLCKGKYFGFPEISQNFNVNGTITPFGKKSREKLCFISCSKNEGIVFICLSIERNHANTRHDISECHFFYIFFLKIKKRLTKRRNINFLQRNFELISNFLGIILMFF